MHDDRTTWIKAATLELVLKGESELDAAMEAEDIYDNLRGEGFDTTTLDPAGYVRSYHRWSPAEPPPAKPGREPASVVGDMPDGIASIVIDGQDGRARIIADISYVNCGDQPASYALRGHPSLGTDTWVTAWRNHVDLTLQSPPGPRSWNMLKDAVRLDEAASIAERQGRPGAAREG